MSFVLFLHVAASIFLIGPLTVATSVSPRYIRLGAEGLPVLRFLHQTTRIYGGASVLVFLLGLWLGSTGDNHLSQPWLTVSMTLFIVALGLVFGLVYRDQARAVARISAGEAASVKAGRVAGVSAAVALIWLVILLLMVFQPGQPST